MQHTTVYPSFFKTIQRCWAHILRDAEEAYVSAGKNSPKREARRMPLTMSPCGGE